jgi:hypothetical protein
MARLPSSSLPVSIKRVQAGSATSASSASHRFQSRSLCAKAAQGAHISIKAIEDAFIADCPDLPLPAMRTILRQARDGQAIYRCGRILGKQIFLR